MDAIFLFFFGFVFIFSLGLTHSFIYGFIITISIFFIFGLISKQMEASKKVSKEARWKREKEEEQRKQKEEQLKLEEKRKQLIEEKRPRDIKEYHRIINCPLCEGNGKAYIRCYGSGGTGYPGRQFRERASLIAIVYIKDLY